MARFGTVNPGVKLRSEIAGAGPFGHSVRCEWFDGSVTVTFIRTAAAGLMPESSPGTPYSEDTSTDRPSPPRHALAGRVSRTRTGVSGTKLPELEISWVESVNHPLTSTITWVVPAKLATETMPPGTILTIALLAT